MSMATLQLYKNKWHYPDFGSITAYGNSMPCTPVGTGLKSGSIKVKGNMADFMNCNYLGLTRSGKTIYAWIEEVKFSTANSFEVAYRVDPWRTYRSNITLGNQFIERSPVVTTKRDDMLGASKQQPDISTKLIWKTPNTNARVFIVQVRPSGSSHSNTPVQPSPYQFYAMPYNVNNWTDNQAISELMIKLREGAQTTNIVTVYSIPYMQVSELPLASMPIERGEDVEYTQNSWYFIREQIDNIHSLLTRHIPIEIDEDIGELMRVDHSVQLVIPDAGIISIPDELLTQADLQLREDVDLFSGASNYMLVTGSGQYTQSVRGSSVSSIPIISDPMDTYLSQNQNALATSLVGDVAMIGGGLVATAVTGGTGAMVGVGAVATGINGMTNRWANIKDIANGAQSNPPAFLGTALGGAFNNRMWLVVTKQPVDNATLVHSSFGYPLNKIAPLTLPNKGYIKTQGCAVASDGTVPKWAIDEINSLFNNGINVN